MVEFHSVAVRQCKWEFVGQAKNIVMLLSNFGLLVDEYDNLEVNSNGGGTLLP